MTSPPLSPQLSTSLTTSLPTVESPLSPHNTSAPASLTQGVARAFQVTCHLAGHSIPYSSLKT